MAIRPAFFLQTESANALLPEATESLLCGSPHEWIAQEEGVLSSTPIFNNDSPTTAPFVLRAFVIGIGSSFHVIPGGLTLMQTKPKMAATMISLATHSKDTWILSNHVSCVKPKTTPTIVPAQLTEFTPLDIPSRIADNLFWLGRYAERLENILRINRCILGHLNAPHGIASSGRITVLHAMMDQLQLIPEDVSKENSPDTLQMVILGIISEPEWPECVPDIISRIHQSAFTVRDRLSADTWRLFTRLRSDANTHPANLLAASTVLDTLILDLAAFSGMEMENMTRGHGWLFLEIGRRLERSINLLDLLTIALLAHENVLLYEPLLEICDSVITYRRRHFSEIRLCGILELLLLDRGNPRSLAFQFSALERATVNLPESPNPNTVTTIRNLIATLSPYLHSLELKEPVPHESVGKHLIEIHNRLQKISELLTEVFFSHIITRVN